MAAGSTSSNVLIVADPEGRRQVALSRGLLLASRLGCDARVVGFCHESLATLASSKASLADKARESILKRRERSIRAQIRKHQLPGTNVGCQVVWSKRIHEWIQEDCRRRPPLVVVKTSHRSKTFSYTPTDWHLIRDCPAPTMIVAEYKWRKTRPVLAAVDLGTRSRSKLALNDTIIATAKQYADVLNCPLYLLHVVHFSPVLRELELVDELAHTREIKKALQPAVGKLSRKHGVPVENVFLKSGPVHKVITSESARLRAQLLVLGSKGRRGAHARLLGNTAEKVLMLARTDLLVVKS